MQFDLIITDYLMPEMSGIELCARLRESEGYAETPIVMITAKGFELELSHLREAYGISAVFMKPFSPQKVIRAVEGCLEAIAR